MSSMKGKISTLLTILLALTILLFSYSNDVMYLSTNFNVKFVKSLISSILFFILFTYIGYPITKLLTREKISSLLTLFISWNVGILISSFVGKVAEIFGILDTYTLSYVLMGIALLFSYISDADDEIKSLAKEIINNKYLVFVLFLSIIPIVYLRLHSLFPWMLAYDQFAYSGIALSYIRGQPKLDLYPSYHIAMALASSLLRINPIFVYWTAPFLVMPLYVLGIYTLVSEIFEKKEIALIAGSLAPWFNGWGWASDPYTFAPRTFLFLSFPYLLILITRSIKEGERKSRFLTSIIPLIPFLFYLFFKGSSLGEPINIITLIIFTTISVIILRIIRGKNTYLPLLIISFSTLTLLHIIEASFPSMLLVIYAIALSLLSLSRNLGVGISIFLSLFFASYFFSDWIGFSTPITDVILNIGKAPVALTKLLGVAGEGPSSEFKRAMLMQMYTPLILISSLIGMIISLKFSNYPTYPFLLLTSVTFYVIFLPWKWPARVVNYLTTLISSYAGLGLYSLLQYLKKPSTEQREREERTRGRRRGPRFSVERKDYNMVYILVVIFLVLILLIYIPVSYYAYVAVMRSKGYVYLSFLSHFTMGDLIFSEKLWNLLSNGDILVSDPMTKRVIEGLTGLSLRIVSKDTAKKIIYSYTYPLISKLAKGEKVAIAVTGRTLYWLEREIKDVVPAIPPFPLSSYVGLYRLVYSHDTLIPLAYTPTGYLFLTKENVSKKTLIYPITVNGRKVNVTLSYYDRYYAEGRLTLSGSGKYVIKYPKSWTVEYIRVGKKELNPSKLKRIEPDIQIVNVDKKAKIEVVWSTNLLMEDVGLRVHGPNINRNMWSTVSNATMSVYRIQKLGINSSDYPLLITKISGSNALFRIYILFEDGHGIILPRPEMPGFKAPSYPSELLYKYGPYDKGKRVVAISIMAYPQYDKPFDFMIHYLMLARG